MRIRRLGKRSASLLPALAPLALLALDGRAAPTLRALDRPRRDPEPVPGTVGVGLSPAEADLFGMDVAAASSGGEEVSAVSATLIATTETVAVTTVETGDEPTSSAVPTAFLEPLASGTTDPTVPISSSRGAETELTTTTSGTTDTVTTTAPLTMQATQELAGANVITEPTAAVVAGSENAIVLENRKPGNPRSQWDLRNGIGSTSIEGFATQISLNRGSRVDFKVNTAAQDYRIDIYRLGWYGGMGARLVASVDHGGPGLRQPAPLTDPTTKLIDAGNWSVTDGWTIPADATSGVYLAKLVREDGTFGENHIPFIVRADGVASDILFQTADTTWVAYNPWGGTNLYQGTEGRAYAVSYNRPFTTRLNELQSGPQDWIFGAEYPAILWLERNGYDVGYISGIDTARDGAGLLDHKVFLSVGHDEYWSGEQRANVEAARDAGVNLQFWSGNEVYWKIRWETSIDASGTPYRTLVCYKETKAGANIDPSDQWTGTWRDPRFGGTGYPENALTGTLFQVDSYRLDTISIPFDMTKLRFWRDTRVASTPTGQSAVLNDTYLGYEWNIAPDNGFSPEGLIRLSSSTYNVDSLLLDYGTLVGPGTATHNLTLYRDRESGALVFSAGSVYWSWALDANHDNEPAVTDPAVQQAMVNLFADMGVQPQTLEATLVMAAATTDLTPPTAVITSTGIAGGRFLIGTTVSITGTAVDIGGRVAGAEVSTDGGRTWNVATGTTNWSYSWTVSGTLGERTVLARATDDSVNTGLPSAGLSVTVYTPPEASLWSLASVPAVLNVNDRQPVELGVRFTTEQSVAMTGFRFYKGDQNTGPHTARLWSSTGTILAQATFTNESASGWQTVSLASPFQLAANTNYVVSYHTTTGYSVTSNYFTDTILSGALTVPGTTNGVYAYGAAGTFPTRSFAASNYWVDVVYTPNETPVNRAPVAVNDNGFTVAQNTPLAIAASLLLANDRDPEGSPLSVVSVGGAVGGTVALSADKLTVTFTPTTGFTGAASFAYAASDGALAASATVSLVVSPTTTPYSLFGTPTGTGVANDGLPVNLGMRFGVSADGTIAALRYFKPTQETGTHRAYLWTTTGTLLASAVFTNETASGWQTAYLATPVSVAAGSSYIVSYASNGAYVFTSGGLATTITSGPLTAPASTASAGNGVYAYGAAGLFPSATYNAANYYADVIYYRSAEPVNRAPVAVNDAGFTTARGTPLVIDVGTLLANDTDADGDVLSVTGVSGAVNGLVSLDAQTGRITFAPTAGYSGAAGFTYAVADGNGGVGSAQVSLIVTAPTVGSGLFAATDVPSIITVNDPNSVELGMKFTTSTAGDVTGFRFYKGPQNTGPHEARLWTSTGTLLASATFTNETASGWQTTGLAQPVSLTANTTYVVSYHSNGFYSATPDYFASADVAGSLTAPASDASGGNGVYAYGPSGSFPTSTYNRTNYWVDVVFSGQIAA